MYLGEVIGPGARCTVTNYNATSSYQLRVHVLVLYASMAAARGPGPLPARFPRSLIPALERAAGTPFPWISPCSSGFRMLGAAAGVSGALPGAQPFLTVRTPGSPLASALALKVFL